MTTSRSPRKTRYDEAALPVRTAIYTRISLDSSGEGPGIQRQLDECLALADRLGWQVVARLSDKDVSAFNGKRRDGFEDLLDGLKNKRFGAVIVWHVDRLYRTLKDLARLLEVASGVQIRTVNGGDFDLSTATGRMVATILGSVAVQESEHKGERQRAANAQKATAGTWQTANRCSGYTTDGDPVEPEASALRAAVIDVLAGHSVQSIAKRWNAAGLTGTLGRPWNSPGVRRTLINPRYVALKVHRGTVVGPGASTAAGSAAAR
jgi:site-specific DNA recombinase